MIVWNIILSVFVLAFGSFTVYTFLKGMLNTKAITTIIGPDIDLIKKEIKKIKNSL